jgi:pyridinium-3,5-bisthiocarboxylic acid mononucleotide nickel chelatase
MESADGQRVLYLEPVGGIAGDMFLAAMLDLGVSLEALEAGLKRLDLPGWRLEVTRAERHGLVGTHVDVVLEHPEHHPHRSYRDIEALVTRAGLPEAATANALKIFRLLGEAEARIHGVSLDDIHFHEVGAVDSIVDICGAALALELLGSPVVLSAPPPLGTGMARIAHGMVPVPVPATLELLKGLPVRFEGQGELTTPTGAALLKALATVGPPPELTVERIGYGVGTKDWSDRANVLRASMASAGQERPAGALGAQESALAVLECNLDDCSPQLVGALLETLLQRGALDAWVAPVLMKKGRPGHLVGVLTSLEKRELMLRTLLEESTTLGVRESRVRRTELQRRWEKVETPWGPVRMKLGLLGERVLNAAPELEDCRAVASAADVPLKEVLGAAAAAWRGALARGG